VANELRLRPPEADVLCARSRAMTFEALKKSARGQRWEVMQSSLNDLVVAVDFARAFHAYESAVFTEGPTPLGGFQYWTSRAPDLFNSTVISQEVSQ
jgi:hypothetical protein